MEIAISGIVIIVLLLPGILFNKGYYSGEFKRQYISNDFYSLLINTLLPSLTIYLIILPFIFFTKGYFYDIKCFLGLISSNDDLVKTSIEQVETFISEILYFQIFINILSFILGKSIHNLILKNSFDTKYNLLRFDNIWHYLISSRFLSYNNILVNDTPEDVDITFIDALVQINDLTYIYTGFLVDYQLGKDGTLDLLIISNAQRKVITGNDNTDYKDIKGNFIVLKYCDLININFSFIQLDTEIDTDNNIIGVTPRLIE